LRQCLRCGSLLPDGDNMSLQWHSPAEAAVAHLVQRHRGITPTKWECLEALDRNRDGSYLDAADELLWKYAVERQQLDALSPTERMVANIVRDKTGYVPTQHECGFYLQLHNDNIQDAATGVRNEYNRAQTRHEEQALRAQPQQPTRFCPSTGATPFLDAFLSSKSMPTPTVDLATERFRATGGIGERMVQTEEDVAAVRDFIFGSQLTSTDGALNSISAKRVNSQFLGISIVPRSQTAKVGRRNHLGRPSLANQVWRRGL